MGQRVYWPMRSFKGVKSAMRMRIQKQSKKEMEYTKIHTVSTLPRYCCSLSADNLHYTSRSYPFALFSHPSSQNHQTLWGNLYRTCCLKILNMNWIHLCMHRTVLFRFKLMSEGLWTHQHRCRIFMSHASIMLHYILCHCV